MTKLSAIIVTIGAKDYINSSLDSLLNQTCRPEEVIIIDNSLKPDFSRQINKLYLAVKVFSGLQNLFYAEGLNKGIRLSSGEFILCLNDDVILDKNFVRQALAGFLINEKVGIVGGKVLRRNGKILDSTGLFLTLWRTAKDRGYGMRDSGRFDKAGFVFGVNGSVVLYRRRMLEEIKGTNGYFDSKFRMFYEDLDISWRAKMMGWFAYYAPAALAYHVRGGSFRCDSGIDKPIARRYLNEELHYELIKNRYLAILKNESFIGLLLHFIPIFIYDLCVWFFILVFQPKLIKFIFSRLKGKIAPERKTFDN